MTLDQYQELAMRTAKPMEFQMALIHGALGLTSDAGEAATEVKSHVVYGKPLNGEALAKELGDVLWFVTYTAWTLGMDLEEIANINIDKLRARYPDGYTDKAAIARADEVKE